MLQQEQRGDRENFLSELLTHLDLLGNTVQFLHDVSNISSLDHEDSKKWTDLENVFAEVEKEFFSLYNFYII